MRIRTLVSFAACLAIPGLLIAAAAPTTRPATKTPSTAQPAPAAKAAAKPAVAPAPVGKNVSTPRIPAPPTPAAPYDFVRDVMPLISRLGCNAVACHGSPKGKGGFNLSMFGADPVADYEALTKAEGSRRINRVEPEKSLFLLKPTQSIPHPKKKLEVGSPQYNMLLAWIANGTPLSRPSAPTLASITATPAQRTLSKTGTQQLSVTAVFSDGSKKDVTATALFSVNDASIATVDENGLITAKGFGETIVVASYLRQPATVRITIPQPLPTGFPAVSAASRIDELVFAKLKVLGIPPADLCTDQEFLRRVHLDVTGTLPTPQETRAWLADTDPAKRQKLIDRLLEGEEFADYWAMKWADLFRIKSEFPVNLWPNAVQAYHRWVRMSIAANKPYDQFVRELLTASGSNFRVPPANFFRGFLTKDPQNVTEVAALTFMGVRLGCARCHGHPTENWTLNDNLGLAAFFSQVRYKSTMEWKEEIVYVDTRAVMRNPRTSEVVKPRLLGGETPEIDPTQDARVKFAAWLTAPENPYFTRNIANRVWFWLLGRGIVHEADDLRPTNPPKNPELLDYLAQELIRNKYNIKHLYRLILNSRTYQLSSRTNDYNRADTAYFSHYYVKRLGAETLLDAIGQVTGKWDTYSSIIPEPFVVLPAGFRATHLADGSISLPFLELFGRPPRDTAYESDRDLELHLRQTLHLLNSNDVHNKIAASPWLATLMKDIPEETKIIDEIYLATVSRLPTPEEKKRLLGFFASAAETRPATVFDDQKAATDALARLRADVSKLSAQIDALNRSIKDTEATHAKARDPQLKNDLGRQVTEKRKDLASMKAALAKLAASEKPAVARVNDANKKVETAKNEVRQRRVQTIQDILWALINTKEFVFNH